MMSNDFIVLYHLNIVKEVQNITSNTFILSGDDINDLIAGSSRNGIDNNVGYKYKM